MKQILLSLAMALLPLLAFGQSVIVLNSLEMLPNSNALVKYNNEFGRFENKEIDDSFPYVVIRMELQGDVRDAKMRLSLDLGSSYKIEAADKNHDNMILFLIPKGARSIYLLCGDGCEKQQLHYGALQENKEYVCKVEYRKELAQTNGEGASSQEMETMKKQMEEMKQMLQSMNNGNHNGTEPVQNNNQNTTTENKTTTNIVAFKDPKDIKAQVTYHGDVAEVVVNGLQFRLIKVAGGTFKMGNKKGEKDEQNVHKITLDDYFIGEMEVTQALWYAVMGTTIWQQRDKEFSRLPTWGEGDDYPMYYVSWEECQEFITRLNNATGLQFSLPTEAQWEYAAREGGKKPTDMTMGELLVSIFGSGVTSTRLTDFANGNLSPVGSAKANKLGIYDLTGNAAEWCSDWYTTTYITTQTDNPTGPVMGSQKVIRDKAKNNSQISNTPTARSSALPEHREGRLGFRLVLTL